MTNQMPYAKGLGIVALAGNGNLYAGATDPLGNGSGGVVTVLNGPPSPPNKPGPFGQNQGQPLACVRGQVDTAHVVTISDGGVLWHTESGFADRSWTFDRVTSSGGAENFFGVSAATLAGELNVIATGGPYAKSVIWSTVLHANGWAKQFQNVSKLIPGGLDVEGEIFTASTASVDGRSLDVVALQRNGRMLHTSRSHAGKWSAFDAPNVGGMLFNDSSCSGANGILHVVAVEMGSSYGIYYLAYENGKPTALSRVPAKVDVGGEVDRYVDVMFTQVGCSLDASGVLNILGTDLIGIVWLIQRFADGTWSGPEAQPVLDPHPWGAYYSAECCPTTTIGLVRQWPPVSKSQRRALEELETANTARSHDV